VRVAESWVFGSQAAGSRSLCEVGLRRGSLGLRVQAPLLAVLAVRHFVLDSPLHSQPPGLPPLGLLPLWTLCLLRVAGLHTVRVAESWVFGSQAAGSQVSGTLALRKVTASTVYKLKKKRLLGLLF